MNNNPVPPTMDLSLWVIATVRELASTMAEIQDVLTAALEAATQPSNEKGEQRCESPDTHV